MERVGFGLRLVIVLALSVAFVVAFVLLGVVTVRLSSHSRADFRVRDAEATASVLAVALSDPSGRSARFAALSEAALGKGGVRGVELRLPDREPWVRGITGLGVPVEARLGGTEGEASSDVASDGAVVRLWVRAPGAALTGRYDDLLFLYAVLTGGVILVFAYLALTHLIVRPVEALTHASERVARGQLEVEVPVRGAAEVRRLATAFNRMGTQIRRDRGELESRLAQLERATGELDVVERQVLRTARLASVGRLAAGVAHEIGNPLAAILGLIELCRADDVDAGERDEFLARIQAETERIHRIIRDLLDFSRQSPEEDRGDADLVEVVEDALRLVSPQRTLHGVKVTRALADDVPRVAGSPDRWTQVVLNLLLNAADALDGRGALVITVAAADEGAWVVLRVEDDGPGIPEALLDELFEPFVTSKPVGQGTGLGLAVCHTIVERFGGTIEAGNRPGGGARFELRLRRARGNE